jgi:hypothetical protein
MKECDISKIHISSNFILSISLLIMFDTLLLRPSLHYNIPLHSPHFTQLHFINFATLHHILPNYTSLHLSRLHPTTLYYTSPHFTQIHFTTLIDTSPHFTQLHFTTLRYTLHNSISLHSATLHHTSPSYTLLHLSTPHHTSPNYTLLHFTHLHFTTLCYTSPHFTQLHFTTLTDTSLPLIRTSLPSHLALRINLLNPTGHVMHHQFNIQQLYALPTLYLCVLYLSEKNNDSCQLQHKLIGFYNRDEKCLQRGTDWVFK